MRETNLDNMSEYWDTQAVDDAMLHIAHAENKTEFYKIGILDVDKFIRIHNSWKPNSKNLDILDIGCGIGRMVKEFSKREICGKIIGVDVSEKMIEQGIKYCDNPEKITLIKTSGKDLKEIKDESIDFVYSHIVFQHMPRKLLPEYIAEAYRVLRKGGIFIFYVPSVASQILKHGTLPNEPPDDNYRWMRYYTAQEIYEIAQRHFNVCQITKDIIVTLVKR